MAEHQITVYFPACFRQILIQVLHRVFDGNIGNVQQLLSIRREMIPAYASRYIRDLDTVTPTRLHFPKLH